MTVTVVKDVQINTFSESEMATLTDALKIAEVQYRAMAETHTNTAGAFPQLAAQCRQFSEQFEKQAREAADLQLKIEAGR